MSNHFYPVDGLPDSSVPDAVVPARRRRHGGKIGLAAVALALVAGGTVGGITLGPQLFGNEHGPGFGTVTSQAFTGGQEEPNEPAQGGPASQTHHGDEGGEAD